MSEGICLRGGGGAGGTLDGRGSQEAKTGSSSAFFRPFVREEAADLGVTSPGWELRGWPWKGSTSGTAVIPLFSASSPHMRLDSGENRVEFSSGRRRRLRGGEEHPVTGCHHGQRPHGQEGQRDGERWVTVPVPVPVESVHQPHVICGLCFIGSDPSSHLGKHLPALTEALGSRGE